MPYKYLSSKYIGHHPTSIEGVKYTFIKIRNFIHYNVHLFLCDAFYNCQVTSLNGIEQFLDDLNNEEVIDCLKYVAHPTVYSVKLFVTPLIMIDVENKYATRIKQIFQTTIKNTYRYKSTNKKNRIFYLINLEKFKKLYPKV